MSGFSPHTSIRTSKGCKRFNIPATSPFPSIDQSVLARLLKILRACFVEGGCWRGLWAGGMGVGLPPPPNRLTWRGGGLFLHSGELFSGFCRRNEIKFLIRYLCGINYGMSICCMQHLLPTHARTTILEDTSHVLSWKKLVSLRRLKKSPLCAGFKLWDWL